MICALTPTWWYLTYQQSWQWGRWAPWLVDFPQATRRRRAPRESAQLRSPGRATPEKGLSLKSRVKMFYRRGCPFDEVPVAVQGHQHHREVLQEPHHLIVTPYRKAFSTFDPPHTSFPLALSTFILVWRTYLYCMQHIEKRWSMAGPRSST